MDRYNIRLHRDNIFLTGVNNKYFPLFLDWHDSLRTNGKFVGSIGVINDDLSENNLKIIKSLKCEIITSSKFTNYFIVDRFIDYLFYFKANKYKIAIMTDCDCWFQSDINTIFKLASKNICFTPDTKTFSQHNILESDHPQFNDAEIKLQNLKNTTNTINAGFIAGPTSLLILKFEKYFDLFKSKILKGQYYHDQFALNYLLEQSDNLIKQEVWNNNNFVLGYEVNGNKIYCNDFLSKVIHLAGISDKLNSKFRYLNFKI